MNQLRDYEDETAATALSAHAPFVVECLRDYAQLLRDGAVDGAGRYFPAEIDATADRIEAGAQPADPTVPITARYTNWRGETRERVFIPQRVYFGSNEWHPEPQVLIDAIDCETGNARTFAAAGFAAPAAEPVADWSDVASQIIGEIEQRFPNWRSYRDLIDCIDCTLHDLRSRAAEAGR
ncbi:hypothetical protein Ga0061061_1107 [Chelatococcus sambhunathii]|uniref:Uncharacterized protein n=1 Tax=Chelatococcus sambhunathii TaxID=363953 RepID=A0ABP2AC62_9HYPH|nr:hypothetical protein [Chelatococcus sambhunathii]CUA89812.1 hypothetical protein Ga0061061_1107 [Chelatococcus sambhunathii]